MPAKYTPCPKAIHEQAYAILKEHHADLHAAGVTVDLIFAYAGENDAGEKIGPALKLGGYACAGIASKVPLLGRVMGRADVQVLLDGDKWEELHEDQQTALIDHEITHFALAKDSEGGTILDTHGRPKIKMKLHDFDFGWFTSIAERYKEASGEVIQAAQLYQQAGQSYFPFLGQQALAIADPEKTGKKGKKSK